MSPITHVVMFQPKVEISAEDRKTLFDEMLDLKSKCLSPTNGKPYIKSMIGGKDNSPEGLQKDITHMFVAEFDSSEDRDYYVKDDPAHLAFIEKNGPKLAKVQVIDFTPGVF